MKRMRRLEQLPRNSAASGTQPTRPPLRSASRNPPKFYQKHSLHQTAQKKSPPENAVEKGRRGLRNRRRHKQPSRLNLLLRSPPAAANRLVRVPRWRLGLPCPEQNLTDPTRWPVIILWMLPPVFWLPESQRRLRKVIGRAAAALPLAVGRTVAATTVPVSHLSRRRLPRTQEAATVPIKTGKPHLHPATPAAQTVAAPMEAPGAQSNP